MEKFNTPEPQPKIGDIDFTPVEEVAAAVYSQLFKGAPEHHKCLRDGSILHLLNIPVAINTILTDIANNNPDELISAFTALRNNDPVPLHRQAGTQEEQYNLAMPELMIGTVLFAAARLSGDAETVSNQLASFADLIRKRKKIKSGDALTDSALEAIKSEYHLPSKNSRVFPLMLGIRDIIAEPLRNRLGQVPNFISEAQIAKKCEKLLEDIGASPKIIEQWAQGLSDAGKFDEVIDPSLLSAAAKAEQDQLIERGKGRYLAIRTTRELIDNIADGTLNYGALESLWQKIQEQNESQYAQSLTATFEEVEITFLPAVEGERGKKAKMTVTPNDASDKQTTFELDNSEVKRLMLLFDARNALITKGYNPSDIGFVQSKLDAKNQRRTAEGKIPSIYYGVTVKLEPENNEVAQSIFVVNPVDGHRHAAYVVNGQAFGGLNWQHVLDNHKEEAHNEKALSLLHIRDITGRAIELMTNPGKYEREWTNRQKRRRLPGRRAVRTAVAQLDS